jgi:hypothetical protein
LQTQTKIKRQQARLSANIRQAKSNRADVQAAAHGKSQAKPAVQAAGFAAWLRVKLFGRADSPQTAQTSIPYREMHRDGVCHVADKLYTKTAKFGDINYLLAQNDDKTAIFDAYCEFLNYFDASISVQLTFVNQRFNIREFEQSVHIPQKDDAFDSIRREYGDMLKNQLARGNNGLVKTKYITFGIHAESLSEARPRLERVETDALNHFKTLGVSARPLSGLERLGIIHGQFHPDANEKLRFDFDDIIQTGISTKDAIAPTSFDFREGRVFKIGEYCGAVSFVQISAPELTDRMLADFLDMQSPVTVTLHIQSIDQAEAIKTVKRKLSDLDAMKISEQKKAVRAGYDMLRPDRV